VIIIFKVIYEQLRLPSGLGGSLGPEALARHGKHRSNQKNRSFLHVYFALNITWTSRETRGVLQ